MTTTGGQRGSRWVAFIVLAALVACQGDRREAEAEAEAQARVEARARARAEARAEVQGGLVVVEPWVRTAIRPEGADAEGAPPVNSAGYGVIRNPGSEDDALIAAEAAISDTVEIHSVSMDDGVMRMRPVDAVAVPAGGEAVLEPGGYHLMFIGIHEALAEGDTVALTLRFRSGAVLEVSAPVRRSAPAM